MKKRGLAAALGSLLSLVACGGGGGDTVTNTTTTSSVATTTSTVASTTTTSTVAPTFTTAWRADNTPCVAPSDAPVSCEFVASTTGGQSPFTYSWDFRTPMNNIAASGQSVRPAFTCGLSTGTTSFDVTVTLTVRDNAGLMAMMVERQQIARAKGACGTPP
jgi:hypothetical protein